MIFVWIKMHFGVPRPSLQVWGRSRESTCNAQQQHGSKPSKMCFQCMCRHLRMDMPSTGFKSNQAFLHIARYTGEQRKKLWKWWFEKSCLISTSTSVTRKLIYYVIIFLSLINKVWSIDLLCNSVIFLVLSGHHIIWRKHHCELQRVIKSLISFSAVSTD